MLRTVPAGDLWGVGRRLAPRLEAMGIATAAALRHAPADDVLAAFGVTLARTRRELQGRPCMELDRSFADRVEDHEAVALALATFAVRTCETQAVPGLLTRARHRIDQTHIATFCMRVIKAQGPD